VQGRIVLVVRAGEVATNFFSQTFHWLGDKSGRKEIRYKEIMGYFWGNNQNIPSGAISSGTIKFLNEINF
jgi:hypothetical protein